MKRKKKKPNREFYFAYGSNLHMEQMKQRCPDSTPVGKGVLKDFTPTFRRVADVVPEKGAVVYGAVYEVSPRDKRALDYYEGYPNLYTRFWVTIEMDNGQKVNAFIYVMWAGALQPPAKYYLNIIKEGFKNWGLPLEYLYQASEWKKAGMTWSNKNRRGTMIW